ncbi:MAG: TonB-dependent receptor [Flavobacteriales bacterium]|nr:TonB-dependent receptor [Flavobacteriales bacterium]
MSTAENQTPEREILSTARKALRVNLDPAFYGSFAEIGAGQDVANIFFEAGGASQTVAKTMSAYDMAFSDSIYGVEADGRYVSQSRVIKMLDHEYDLLEERLPERKKDTCFFAFANTVATINFHKTRPGHGWLGCRFQCSPETEPNELVIHVRLKEPEKLLQHKTLGVVGTNLIYACRFLREDPLAIMLSLMDNLSWDKLEVDYFSLTGPDFEHVDNRLMSLKMVKHGLTDATMFLPDGDMIQPADLLYKKNVLVLRSRFKPITLTGIDMLKNAIRDFTSEPDVNPDETVVVSELSLNHLRMTDREIDERDFLDRADTLCALGHTVMISQFKEYHILSKYITRFYTRKKVGLVLGLPNLTGLFDEKVYDALPGGILEAMSRMFTNQVKMYVYPMLGENGQILKLKDFDCPEGVKPLFDYLIQNNKMADIANFNPDVLGIFADDVLRMIHEGNPEWEKFVPVYVANIIKEKHIFGYTDKVNN